MKKVKENVISYTIDKAIFGDFAILVNNGEVVVKAPWYFSKQRIQDAIKENKNWIIKKLNEMEEVSLYNSAKILGINYAVKVIYANIKTPELNLNNNYIEIKLPAKLKGRNNKKIIDVILNKMYAKLAERHLENVCEEIRIETGLVPEDYSIIQNSKEMAKFDFDKKEISKMSDKTNLSVEQLLKKANNASSLIEALEYSNLALKKKYCYKTLMLRGIIFENLLMYDEAIEEYNCAYFEEQEDLECVKALMYLYIMTFKYNRAVDMAIEILEKESDKKEKCDTMISLIAIYVEQDQLSKA